MCTLTDGFKLCTCKADIPKGTPYWELKRWHNITDVCSIQMGRCMNLTYTHLQQAFGNQLLSLLNHTATQSVFDFDYTPMMDDVLNMTFYNNDVAIKFEFCFDGSVWQIQTQLSEHLNKDLIIKKGKFMSYGCDV